MIKIILPIFALLIPISPAFGMRHIYARPHTAKQKVGITKNRPMQRYSTNHHEDNEYETKRQETWLRLKFDVAERICLMKEKAKKHHELAKQKPHHAYYARACQTLAELEHAKFELFKHTIEKLGTSALYFEEPDMEAEFKLMAVLDETHAHFYNALPNDDKI